MAGDGDGDLPGADGAARGLDAGDAAILDPEARHLAILDDIDAAGIGGAGEAPGDGIMPRGAAAALQAGADDRVARLRPDMDDRAPFLELRGSEEF